MEFERCQRFLGELGSPRQQLTNPMKNDTFQIVSL